MKKAALHNLGCKVNGYETEAMQQLLEKEGYEIVPFQEYADVYVINTCSVTNMADRKSRQMLHRAKKQNPNAIVVAAGCYVQTKEEEAQKDPAIDIMIGNNSKGMLLEKIRLFEKSREAVADVKNDIDKNFVQEQNVWDEVLDINHIKTEFEELTLTKTAEHTRAFVKVQDGCNQFCSYCIIPYARGRVRSRSLSNVIAEVRGLAQKGYQEVVLTGIHLSSYGIDCADSLLHLIQEVCAVDGIKRVRLGSLEPKIVTEEFARSLSSLKKVCPHFHLSLQSGCDATLQRMNRRYTTEEYENGCRILRRYFEHPAITTDVIVGFPGETDEEFEETKEFLKRIHFYEMHIFKYSVRQGTRAADMPNQVPEEIKAKRSAELIALSSQMSEEFRRDYIGTVQEVLLEEQVQLDGEAYYTGYTREYVKAALRQSVGEGMENQLICGEIGTPLTPEIYLLKTPKE